MSQIMFRTMEETDIQPLMDIYNHYVLHTTASFHTEPVTFEEFTDTVVHASSRYQTFVIFVEGRLQGYVQVTPHKKKASL